MLTERKIWHMLKSPLNGLERRWLMPLQTEKEVRRLGLHEQVAANDPVIIEEVVEGMRRMFMEYIWVFKAPLLLPACVAMTFRPPSGFCGLLLLMRRTTMARNE